MSLSSINRREGKNKRRRKGGKKREDNTFERSWTTGGRKEATEDGRWLCLCFGFAVNRGFGSNKLSRSPSPLGDSLFMFRIALSFPCFIAPFHAWPLPQGLFSVRFWFLRCYPHRSALIYMSKYLSA